MLSKNKIKYINSLKQKKYRDLHACFIAEGYKIITDLYNSGLEIELLLARSNVEVKTLSIKSKEIIVDCSEAEMKKVSSLSSGTDLLAVFAQNKTVFDSAVATTELVLFLDTIQDPGNMGTILRTADWYGIKNIYCTANTADIYNPKVIQASMGAVARVRVHYLEAEMFFKALATDVGVYGTFLNGKNMYDEALAETGVIVMGNEGNGISGEVEKYIKNRLYIPHFPQEKKNSESLNVAIATGIMLAEFRRRTAL